MFRILTVFFLLSFSISVSVAQINAYARVTAISGNTLTLSNVNESYGDTFENGEQIIIMQMQDNVIGTNTSNTSTFGDLSAIGSAGLFEVLTISTITESGGVPTSITISSGLLNTYNTGANSRVQIISFRLYGNPDYTLTSGLTAAAWNGDVGGVIAFRVAGVLTLGGGSSISANNAGFRGGARSANFYSNTMADCYPSVYASSSTTQSAAKGEGIFNRNGNAAYANGRAKIINGGGGGNHINAGGGGGGNYTTGGTGGGGWSCASSVGGDGGLGLSTYISGSRVFMGGGGGGGQQNDSNGGNGGSGGGIVLIKADQIRTTGICGGRNITANGQAGVDADNDGAGGGGAGGSIVFQVTSWNVAGTCGVNVRANGGDGGDVGDAASHGGGGGGGQGRVIYSSASPSNVTTQTNNGTSGCNNSACSSTAPAPSGTNGTGISSGAGTTALPVSLLYFRAAYDAEEKIVMLNWATASEKNNKGFVVEKSKDGVQFYTIADVSGTGTTTQKQVYSVEDFSPVSGITYYRLRQIDFNEEVTFFDVASVRIEAVDSQLEVYPNPASQGDVIHFRLTGDANVESFYLLDGKGFKQNINTKSSVKSYGVTELYTSELRTGVYILKVHSSEGITTRKIFVR